MGKNIRYMIRKTTIAVALVGISVVGAQVLVPGVASAQTASGQSGSSTTAIITPLLRMFDFGDTVALPLACGTGISLLPTAASEVNLGGEVSPLANQLDLQCLKVSQAGDNFLQQAEAESAALAFINPVVDPYIAAIDTADQAFVTQYGASIFPFGPALSGLGNDVSFFEGD